MDDIWDVKAWDEIKISLPNSRNRSRVIFTTRIHTVALQAQGDCILHHLRFLSNKESWELLQNKVFRAEGCPPAFAEVGKMIAEKCNGLPLTLVLIAGLLARTERNLNRWDEIARSINVSAKGCMDMLELSYQHLPEYLKPCFLYFGVFAKDTIIRVNKLTLLWIAEGFVQNSYGVNLKHVAKEYLHDLVGRSLVIACERSSNGGIKSCRIHDLVHAFCQGKAQEENLFQLMDGNNSFIPPSSTIHNPYRVCIHMNGKYQKEAPKICPNIHSLLSTAIHDAGNLKLVQVMDLKDLIRWGNMKLVHLRYIAGPTIPGTRIPYSISNLWNLEILILTGRRSVLELPRTIWNMTRLRHVDVGRCYLSNSGVKKREAYPQMVYLESFSSPTIYSTKDLEDLLQRSPSLKKLSFHYEYEEKLEKISHTLIYNEPQKDFHFPKLDSLSKLESLKVHSVGEACLRSFYFLSSLKKLSLLYCCLDWRYLPVISNMPCLEVLKLLCDSFVGPKWDMEDTEFPMLKFLKLEILDLAEWIAYVESFPSLEVLIVAGCDKLKTIPPCFGEMITLKRIEVYGSYKAAASVVEIEEAQKDFGNESLYVSYPGGACLGSFNFLSSLQKLSLSDYRLNWRYLQVISKMPCLEVLKLLAASFAGPKWDMEDSEFPKLKFLELQGLNLAEWIAHGKPFPSLEVLIVAGCDKLKTIPPCFGEMLTLKRIEVYASHKSVASSVVEIQESQKHFGNEELQVILQEQWDLYPLSE